MRKLLLAFLALPLFLATASVAQEKKVEPMSPAKVEQPAPVILQAAPAQDPLPVAVQAPAQNDDEAMSLLRSLGGAQGAGSLALIALLVQAIMLIINSKYGALAGKYRFMMMYALNAVSGIIALKMQGIDTITALTHSNTMAAYQVMVNQAYKQFFKREN